MLVPLLQDASHLAHGGDVNASGDRDGECGEAETRTETLLPERRLGVSDRCGCRRDDSGSDKTWSKRTAQRAG